MHAVACSDHRAGNGSHRHRARCARNVPWRDCADDGTSPVLPRAPNRQALGRAVGSDAQRALDDLKFGPVIATDIGKPATVARLVVHAVRAARDAPDERHADLRAETGGQAQRVLDRVAATAAEVEGTEVGVRLLEVRNRRYDTELEHLNRDHVFHAHCHCVAREAFRVRHDDLIRRIPEGATQRRHFRRSAAPARGRKGLVRHEDGLRRDRIAVDAEAAFGRANEPLHHQ